jgi:hypothetical protein
MTIHVFLSLCLFVCLFFCSYVCEISNTGQFQSIDITISRSELASTHLLVTPPNFPNQLTFLGCKAAGEWCFNTRQGNTEIMVILDAYLLPF